MNKAGQRDAAPWGNPALPWLVGSLVPLGLAAITLAAGTWPAGWRTVIAAGGIAGSLGVAAWGGRRLALAWRNLAMLMGALREGDYAHRGAPGSSGQRMQAMVADLNALSDTLRDGRRQRTEAVRFLGKIMAALQSPIIVVDHERRVSMINPAARELFDLGDAGVVGSDAAATGLGRLFDLDDNVVHAAAFPAKTGRWIVRRAAWYSGGHEHTMVILHDVSAALGEEERVAWQRLIRVLSHELNNSLTPIGSVVDSLLRLLENEGAAAIEGELREGLDAVGRRALLLARFLSGYGKLARLPPLQRQVFRLDLALGRLARLEPRVAVAVTGDEAISLEGDESQLEQAFINLLRNAAEAAQPLGGGVRLHWCTVGRRIRVTIDDDGPGLPGGGSLFVPFFTTKPEGSGIGLTLTRLIVEAHGGSVELLPRQGARGAIATVLLPINP